MALRPKEPKFSEAPPLALPWIRPLKALRYLVRFGDIMARRSSARAGRGGGLLLGQLLVLRHRIVRQDFALEDPDLHAAGPERRAGRGRAVVHIGAQRVQGHAAFAIPL